MTRNRPPDNVEASRFQKAMRQRKVRFYRDHDRLPDAIEQKAMVVAVWREILGSDGA